MTCLLDDLVIRLATRTAPGLVPARLLHRGALTAACAGRAAEAEAAFEAAARAYRRVLDVEALARLRVQQHMVRARATHDPVREAEMMLEIVRGVNRLDRLESFQPPHELRNARGVLLEWLAASGSGFDADAESTRLTA